MVCSVRREDRHKKRTLFIAREFLLVKLKTLHLNAFLQTVFTEGAVLYRLSLIGPTRKISWMRQTRQPHSPNNYSVTSNTLHILHRIVCVVL